jgi:hypothetical protein
MFENIAGTSPMHFFTAGTRFSSSGPSGYQKQGDPWNKIVTLQEIIDGVQAGTGGAGAASPFAQMGNNLRANAIPMILSLAGVKIAGKLVTRLGISRQFNALTGKRGLGLQSMVRM